jgi:radical SAM superfamily enzyme YgiQ (UPF0313 family)
MKVLLLSANTEKINMPTLPLGLACVAASTQKAGHDVAVVDLMAEKDGPSILMKTIEGRKLRRHSPETMVEWIARWRKAGVDRFYFVDNTFNLPPSYAEEICRKLVKEDLDIKWWGILYPRQIDEKLAEWMARAGCEQASIGFESGSEQILTEMNKRFTLEEVRQISDVLSGQGIKRFGFLLLGGPGETRESVEESLIFSDQDINENLTPNSLLLTGG